MRGENIHWCLPFQPTDVHGWSIDIFEYKNMKSEPKLQYTIQIMIGLCKDRIFVDDGFFQDNYVHGWEIDISQNKNRKFRG